MLEQNLKIVRDFKPMTAEEKAAVVAKVATVAGDGRYELFKSSKTVRRPVPSQAAWVFDDRELSEDRTDEVRL